MVISHAQTICFPYKEWVENHIAPIKAVLDGAHAEVTAEHTQTLKGRINKVGEIKDAVSFTKRLFESSKVRIPPLS